MDFASSPTVYVAADLEWNKDEFGLLLRERHHRCRLPTFAHSDLLISSRAPFAIARPLCIALWIPCIAAVFVSVIMFLSSNSFLCYSTSRPYYSNRCCRICIILRSSASSPQRLPGFLNVSKDSGTLASRYELCTLVSYIITDSYE